MPGTLTITPAPLVITADDQTKTEGQAFTFGGTEFTTTGLRNGDTVTSLTIVSDGAAASTTQQAAPIRSTAATLSAQDLPTTSSPSIPAL